MVTRSVHLLIWRGAIRALSFPIKLNEDDDVGALKGQDYDDSLLPYPVEANQI